MPQLSSNWFAPKVTTYNPDRSFVVSNVTRWRLTELLSILPGMIFSRKPGLLGSSELPLAEFEFKNVQFQMDDGGDTGGDGLWIMPIDGERHPTELKEIREHLEQSLQK